MLNEHFIAYADYGKKRQDFVVPKTQDFFNPCT